MDLNLNNPMNKMLIQGVVKNLKKKGAIKIEEKTDGRIRIKFDIGDIYGRAYIEGELYHKFIELWGVDDESISGNRTKRDSSEGTRTEGSSEDRGETGGEAKEKKKEQTEEKGNSIA